ncbi:MULTISPECIES: SOS response-associated peptidase [unclassified Mesorhizobium]|uniref:SOS response-associated peptidase n=1 Tax=unclassified Mesorhizobium TaxID=325217 RepID=UPI001FDFFD7F|nr:MULTISPECIES: SOS response-associated peptidase [unclassified Mesorhizobium]
MCGRFALTATPGQTAAFLGLAELEDFPARYNIAPTQPVLMAIAGLPQAPGSNLSDRQSMLVRWGLIPAWVKDTREFPLLFNARSEGATEKASFRTAMRHRRALVPASGFYEWRQSGGKRGQPYWVRPRHGGLVAFAGLTSHQAARGDVIFCAGFFFFAVWRRAATIAAGPIARYWLASAGCFALLESCLVRSIFLFPGNVFVSAFAGRIRPNRDNW